MGDENVSAEFVKKKPIKDLDNVINPAGGKLLYYDEGNDLKTTNIDDFKSLIISGSKGEATPTSSPTPWNPGDPDLFEKFDITEPGTYTNFKDNSAPTPQPIVVTDLDLKNNLVQIWVTNGVSKKVLSEKITAIPDGVVAENNEDAVSGGEVFKTLNPKSTLLYENKILNSRVSNTFTDNASYNVYILSVEKDDVIKVSNYYGNSSGLEYGYIAFSLDAKTVSSWLFSSSATPIYTTETVTAPDKGFLIINYRKGTANTLITSFSALKNIIYRNEIVSDKEVNNKELPASTSLVYDVNQKVKSLNLQEKSLASNATHTAALSANYRYFGYEKRIFSGKLIEQVTVRITTAGTFSVMRTKGRYTSSFTIIEKKTFNVVVGVNDLDVNMFVDSDEDLTFIDVGDTAAVGYVTGSVNTDGGSFVAYSTVNSTWNTFSNNLNIKVDVIYFDSSKHELKGKTVSVLGDSISTFSGYIPSGNNNFYPRPDSVPDITNVNQTYWGQLISKDGMVLNINNSSSGSQVVSTSGALSFYNRVTNLGSNSDYIFLFGGTNDWGNSVPLGSGDFTQPIDNTTFTGSYRYVIEYILKNHKKSRLIVFIPMQRAVVADTFPSLNTAGVPIQSFIKRVIEICDYYGIDYVRTDLVYTNFNWDAYTGDRTHPNIKGMETIYTIIKQKLLQYNN